MNEQLKILAKSAKQRLKLSQYYQNQKYISQTQIYSNNNAVLTKNATTSHSSTNYINVKNLLSPTLTLNDDNRLWEKVCQIMESQSDITSPLSMLIDHKTYDKLDEIARQIYILRLADKYNQLKKVYLNQQISERKKIV